MTGYLWRVLYETGEIREVTAPNITAALLMTVNIWHPEKVVSIVRMEPASRPEPIPANMVGMVTA